MESQYFPVIRVLLVMQLRPGPCSSLSWGRCGIAHLAVFSKADTGKGLSDLDSTLTSFDCGCSGSWDGSVRGWWREDHTPVAVVQAGPGPGVRCLAMVGPRLVAGRDDGTLQVRHTAQCIA